MSFRGAVAAVGVVVIALTGCSGTKLPKGVPFEVRGTPMASTSVDIAHNVFDPAIIQIPSGSTVTWVNHDDVPHTVKLLDQTGKLLQLPSHSVSSELFGLPTTVYYLCSIHPFMHGKVIVENRAGFGGSGSA